MALMDPIAPNPASLLTSPSSLGAPRAAAGQDTDALLESLGSGWIIPVFYGAAGCDGGAAAAHGIWVVLDRIPPSRGATGTQCEILYRGLAIALAWLRQETRRQQHQQQQGDDMSCSTFTIWFDARFLSLVAMEVILKRQLVEATLSALQLRSAKEAAVGVSLTSANVEVVVVHREADVLAAPLLRAAVSNIVRSCSLPSALVVHYLSVPSIPPDANPGAATAVYESCVSQLPSATALATQALLCDDGAWFLAWWEALRAPPSSCGSSSGVAGVHSGVTTLSSPPRRSRSRDPSDDDHTSTSSPGLRRWCQLLETALEQDVPLRAAIVEEEAREVLRLQFWSLHELQCIGSYLSPPRASSLYQHAVSLGNAEAKERCRMCHEETHLRRDLIDLRMACEEMVVVDALAQHKVGGEETAARRFIAAQERRLRELLVALREEPTNADGSIPPEILPHVASLLLFGREMAPDQPSAAATNSGAVQADGDVLNNASHDASGLMLEATMAYESPRQHHPDVVQLTDMSSQTPSAVSPVPRISRLSYPLRRTLAESCGGRSSDVETSSVVASPPRTTKDVPSPGRAHREVVEVACGNDGATPLYVSSLHERPYGGSPDGSRTEDF